MTDKHSVAPIAMTPSQFQHWLDFMDIGKAKAARLLGVTRQTIYNWLKGRDPIPKMASLACAALAHNIRDYTLPAHAPVIPDEPAPAPAPKPEEPVVLAAPGFGHFGD